MNGKPFEPGNKFGKGRPKGSGYVQICEQWAETKGWQRLFDIAEGKPLFPASGRLKAFLPADSKLQLEAIKTILAYGLGRPRESAPPPQTLEEIYQELTGEETG